MSDSEADSNLKSPLASLAAFAQSKGNLFPSFEQAVQSPVARRLPALFSKVSFDGRTAASSAAAPSSFKDGSDETNGMSGSGKSGGGDTVGVFVLSDETISSVDIPWIHTRGSIGEGIATAVGNHARKGRACSAQISRPDEVIGHLAGRCGAARVMYPTTRTTFQ